MTAFKASGDVEKRKSAYMRFGRSDPDMVDMEKRKSAYMRLADLVFLGALSFLGVREKEREKAK